MKRFFTFFLVLTSFSLFSQVKIGENVDLINSNSILELESSEKAFVLTRVNTTQMNLISPLEGAMVYNTDSQCIFQYNGTIWESLCNNGSGNQMLSFDSATNILTLENGGFVDLSNLLSGLTQNVTSGHTIATHVSNSVSTDIIETITIFMDNGNGTVTFTNEIGISTTVSIVGATGAQGAKGDTGAAGTNGATGAQGAKGDTGADGATGATRCKRRYGSSRN